jgi:ABC-type Fe3+/spermidine/putrescine transport system ATPase subunit
MPDPTHRSPRRYDQRYSSGLRSIVRSAASLARTRSTSSIASRARARPLIREKVRNGIKTLQQKPGITTVHVTHDRQEAMVMADRSVILDAGHAAQIGTPEDTPEDIPRTSQGRPFPIAPYFNDILESYERKVR